MSDNLSPRIIEGRTYSYGSAPVGNFQIVYRPPGPKPTPEEIQRGLDAVFGKRVWPTGDAA